MSDASTEFMAEKWYFISDTHLEPKSTWTQHVVNFLRAADAPVIFGGDIIEGYRRGNTLAKFMSGGELNIELVMYLLEAGAHGKVVAGNHDDQVMPIATYPYMLMSPNKGIAALHGQRFDFWFCSPEAENTADYFSRLAYRLEDSGFPGMGRVARATRDRWWESHILSWMKKENINVVAAGHTHIPMILNQRDGRVLAVAGAWCYGPPYHIVKFDRGLTSLVKWDGEKYV